MSLSFARPAGRQAQDERHKARILESVPDIGEMDRQASWCDQDHVDLHIFALGAKLRIEDFRGIGDALQSFQVNGLFQILQPVPRLDLDKGDQSAALGHQVDLAARGPHPFCQYPPAFQAQEAGRGFFGLTATFFGGLAFHHRDTVGDFASAVRAELVEAFWLLVHRLFESGPSTGSGRTVRRS